LNFQSAELPGIISSNGCSTTGEQAVSFTQSFSTPSTTQPNNILTAEELSKILPLHPETIRRWAREGRIPHRRLGRKIVFLSAEIDTWLSDRLSMSVMPPNLERRQHD
jgi:excisionase family DNA binding protein